jgi:uncharacterized membrane protein YgdD (TMEM256/DUF423 family)
MNLSTFHVRVAAALGFLAVALGAFGAHALKGSWEAGLTAAEAAYRVGVWRTAELYHLVHAVALLALGLAGMGAVRIWTWRCWLAGVSIFSGSLYLLCLTGMKWWGAVTPLGGVLLLAGWLLLALKPGNAPNN